MSRGKKIFIGILVVVAIVIVGVAVSRTGVGGNFFMASDSSGSSSGYQAVFLTNSQVYFGKLSGVASQFPTLKDIYYLQVNNPDGGPVGPDNITLVKLGNELHGPTDEMKINREHILLIEELKDDSNVVDAIKRFREDQ
jgi:hypothetical protein